MSRLSAINSDSQLLGVVWQSTRQLSGVLLSKGDQSGSENLKITALSERVESSSLDSDLLGLSGLESNEVLSSQAAGQETELDTLKGNLSGLGILACELSRKLETLTTSSRIDLDFLDGSNFIQESTLAEKVQSLLTIVGDGDLDLRVANTLELNAQRSVTLVDIDRGSGGDSGQGSNGELELHDD